MYFEEAARETLRLARKKGFKHIDAVVERCEELEVQIRDGRVEKVKQSTSLGLGIRVLIKGRSGFASTEKLDREAIQHTIDKACSNSDFQDPSGVFMPAQAPPIVEQENLGLFEADLQQLSVKDLSRMGLEAETAAREADRRVTAIPYLGVSRGLSERLLLSSLGLEHHQRTNQVGAYCGTLLEESDKRKSGFEFWSRRRWDPEAGLKLGTRAAEKAAELLGAHTIESAGMPVVLDEYCAPRLLGMYFQAFHAEAAQKGVSRLKGRLNDEIGVPELNLLDDPHLQGGGASRAMDDEGTPTRPIRLIESGRFTHFLYHIESASKDDQSSSGHASRSYDSGISTASHNLVIERGEQSLEGLCAIPEQCLLVTQLEGAAGCNPISGDISIGVQGFLIKNGERVQAVDSVTIAGNFFELLLNIQGFGDRYQPNLGSRYIPALLVEGFIVSG